MLNISPAEILLGHGKWIDSSGFVKLVSQKRQVTERQAYNLIKEAHSKKEIIRATLPDRTVLYGLSEFGPIKKEIESELIKAAAQIRVAEIEALGKTPRI